MLLRLRDLLIKQRTAVINTIRGYAAEFGAIATRGPVKVAELLQQAHTEEARVPALALDMLRLLAAQLDAPDVKLKLIEARLMALHREDPVSQCLVSQPGIGPIGAVSFALNRPDPSPAAKALRGGGRPNKGFGCRPIVAIRALGAGVGKLARRKAPSQALTATDSQSILLHIARVPQAV